MNGIDQNMVIQEMENLVLQIHSIMTWTPETKGILFIHLQSWHLLPLKPNNTIPSFYTRFNYIFRRPDIIGASYTSSWKDHPYFVDSRDKVEMSDNLKDSPRKCNGDTSR